VGRGLGVALGVALGVGVTGGVAVGVTDGVTEGVAVGVAVAVGVGRRRRTGRSCRSRRGLPGAGQWIDVGAPTARPN